MAAEPSQNRLGGTEKSLRLGGARADFVASLGRKVSDLRSTLTRVRDLPDDVASREDFRRKLQALASGARMMKFDAMDRAIAEALGAIDRTPKTERLDAMDVDAIEQVLEDLPALAWGDDSARASIVLRAEKTAAPTYSVLVVGPALLAEAFLETAEGNASTFGCECTVDAQAAFDLARSSEPDLLVVDADLEYAAELVEALMDDARTEATPIVVLGSFLETGEASRYVAMGVAKTLGKPTSRESLRAAGLEALEPPTKSTPPSSLGEPTLEQLADRLAKEIRDALVGKLDATSRGQRIPLGEGTEILSALWGSIARVREVVTARTAGAVRFPGKGPEGALPIASPLYEFDVARSDRARARARGSASEVRLQGRRVVVADDDPAVVWFMADLLKTAGCVVHEAFDGKQALEAAYRTSPDIVISDILMPNLDGFSLCRALRRDVALRDVPVILLSWKEDLLQRVRELGAGAAGYVRKESDTRAIVARVREALRPRTRVEARLREDGEVRGRLDGVSVRTLLEIVCAMRPDARVSIRDASFLYEVEIRSGAPLRATRTTGDGSFLRGSRVLAAMLGVSAGRFTVSTATATVDSDLDGNLASQLAKPIARARAATNLLIGPTSAGPTARVVLHDEALQDYLRATPEGARKLALRIAEGASPRALLLEGAADASLLDDLAADLAARGVVAGIEKEDGTDLLGPAVAKLLEYTDSRAAFAPHTATPSPVPASTERVRPELGREELTDADFDEPGACTVDPASFCEIPQGPESARSLEDAVMREIIHRSPEPTDVGVSVQRRSIVEPSELRPRNSPMPPPIDDMDWRDEGTPSHEQMLALAEPTVIDDTLYGEDEESVPFTDTSKAITADLTSSEERDAKEEDDDDGGEFAHKANEADEDDAAPANETGAMTPFTAVTGPETAGRPATRRTWPLVAFVAAIGAVAWAVMHFSGAPVSKLTETSAPEAAQGLPAAGSSMSAKYTVIPSDREVAAGQGMLDVSAAGDAVILVDGAERGRTSASLPLWAGAHDIRVAGAAGETRRTVEVRSGQVAHVAF